MANSEQKPIFMHNNSPSKLQHIDVDHDHEEEIWGAKGCDWFSLCGLKWRRNGIDETDDTLLHQGRGDHAAGETLWNRKLKKLKQFSEKIAGPKWKNFIRKMSGYCRKTQKNRFQYDPYSYALNFDNGDADNDKQGDEYLLQDFNSRFTTPFPDDKRGARSGL